MTGDRPFTQPELTDILARARNPRDYALIEFEHWSGRRISEVLLLTTGAVARNWHTINDIVHVWQPKVDEPIQIVVPDALRDALRHYFAWLAARRFSFTKSRPLFFSPRNPRRALSARQARRIIQQAAAAAGLTGKIGTHSLRKTAAELVHKESGYDLTVVQAFLGHKSIASTGRYVGYQSDRKAREIILTAGRRPDNEPNLFERQA